MIHQFVPGDVAIWRKGRFPMSWPPDGYYDYTRDELKFNSPKQNTTVLIVAIIDRHGAIVLHQSNIWWCPIEAFDVYNTNTINSYL